MSLARKVALNTSALTLGRVALAGSGAIGTVVATRYLGYESFAALTIALLLISVFALMGDAGVYTVVARELARRPDEEDRLMAATLGLGLVVAFAAAVVAVLVSQIAYAGADDYLVRLGTAVMLVQVLLTALAGTATAYLTAHQRMLPVAVASIVSSVGFLIVLALAVSLDWGFTGVAAAYAFGGALTALPILAVRARRPLRVGRDRALWLELARWAAPQGAILALGVLLFRIDSFLLSFLSSDREVADYGVAYKVIEFLVLIPGLFMLTLFPEFARAQRRSPALAGMAQAAFTLLQIAVVPVLLVFIGFAPEVVGVLAGPEYVGAANVLRILTVALAFLYLNSLFFHALVAMGELRRLLYMLLGVLVGNVLLNLWAIPRWGADGAAAIVVLSELATLSIGMWLFREASALPRPFRLARVLSAGLAGTAVVVGARVLSEQAGLPDWATLVAGSACVLAVYAAVLRLLDAIPGELQDLAAGLLARARGRS